MHKRSAVVRFMFFNREDIAYFKPCKLRTKYGRTGHIKEPLGKKGFIPKTIIITLDLLVRYTWSHEVHFRWTVEVAGYCFVEFVQEDLS